MRRIAILFSLALMMIGCSKQGNTTYTFFTGDEIIRQMAETSMSYGFPEHQCDIVIAEYYEGQPVANNIIKGAEDGKKYKIKATEITEYVTVRIDSYASGHSTRKDSETTMYIANVFYLDIGGNTDIVLNESTLCSTKEPK